MPCTGRAQAAIVAAAIVTRDTSMAAAVLVPRQPEVIARARDVARRAGVHVWAKVAADGIEVRFSARLDGTLPPTPTAIDPHGAPLTGVPREC